MKKLKKQAEKIFQDLYKDHCFGVQFDIFDLSKISGPVEKMFLETQDLEKCKELLIELRQKYRKN